MSLMIIKRGIPETFKGVVSDEVTSAKDFLAEIEKRFAKSDKAEISMLLNSLTSKEYKGKGNIRDYIMKISHIVSRLKILKVSYNFQKEKWSLNELISFCVQEEERLKQNKTESAHLASTSKDKGKKRKSSVAKNEVANGEQRPGPFAKYLEEYGIVPQYTMPERSRGYKFYDPNANTIFETGTATFFEDVEFGGRNEVRDIVFEEESVSIPELSYRL
uniref:Uncharacterized protein n=1 Tax=Chenopodium quinoa TaxID=63459 RepID=A0A803LW68_CHEQI